MKKCLRCVVLSFLCFALIFASPLALGGAIKADALSLFTYELSNDESSYSLTAYTGKGIDNVEIPSQYNSKPVISVGEQAFYQKTDIKTVTIPDTIVSIGDRAFCGCTSLDGVTLPDSVTTLGSNAFSICTALTSFTVPAALTKMKEDVLDGSTALTAINVDDNNTAFSDIDGILFNKNQTKLIKIPGAKPITDYSVPVGVTSLAGNAFADNQNITSVIIPEGVTQIPSYEFMGSKLKNITLPASLTKIQSAAFSGCTDLSDVYYYGSAEKLTGVLVVTDNAPFVKAVKHYLHSVTFNSDGAEYAKLSFSVGDPVTAPEAPTKEGSTFVCWFPELPETMPDENLTVNAQWCEGTHNFKKTMSAKADCLSGGYAYFVCQDEGCGIMKEYHTDALGHSDIDGDKICDVCSCPFDGFLTFTENADGSTVTLTDCLRTASGNIVIPEIIAGKTVTAIKDNELMAYLDEITSVTIPNTVTVIPEKMFIGCTKLQNITIGGNVTEIGSSAFYGCSALKNIYYSGTKAQWSAAAGTDSGIPDFVEIQCSDGKICDHSANTNTAVKENEKAADCTAEGSYDEVIYCSVCGLEISRKNITVPATGHTDANDDGKCETCGTVFDKAKYDYYINGGKAVFTVPESRQVDYKSTVSFTVAAENAPDGCCVAVYDGENLIAKSESSKDGGKVSVSKTVEKLQGSKTYTAKLIDGSGKELRSKEIKITVKTDFFSKIIAFFRGLFGKLPKVTL